MRNKKVFVLPFDQAEQILTSPEQLIRVTEDGVWNGTTINKADILSTERDYEKEKEWGRDHNPQLEEREWIPSDAEKHLIAEEKEKIHAMFTSWKNPVGQFKPIHEVLAKEKEEAEREF